MFHDLIKPLLSGKQIVSSSASIRVGTATDKASIYHLNLLVRTGDIFNVMCRLRNSINSIDKSQEKY